MPVQVVKPENLGAEFDIGGEIPDKITLKIDSSLAKSAAGVVGLSASSLQIVSPDAGNLLTGDASGKAFFSPASFAAAETSITFNAASSGFMSIATGGTNGHDLTASFNYADAAFVEGVQDAVGSALLAGVGITYDDVADSIGSALGNLTFGDGLNSSGATAVKVQPDPSSPSLVAVTPSGVSVTPGISPVAGNLAKLGVDSKVLVEPADVAALATEQIQDAFGVNIFKAFPQ